MGRCSCIFDTGDETIRSRFNDENSSTCELDADFLLIIDQRPQYLSILQAICEGFGIQ